MWYVKYTEPFLGHFNGFSFQHFNALSLQIYIFSSGDLLWGISYSQIII